MMFGIKLQKTLPPNDFAHRYKEGETIEQLQKEVNLKRAENELKKNTADAQDHQNIVDLRKIWGKLILIILIATIIFNMLLVIMVGLGIWKFEGNSTFLNVAVSENLVQVVGLVAIVLQSLFRKDK